MQGLPMPTPPDLVLHTTINGRSSTRRLSFTAGSHVQLEN